MNDIIEESNMQDTGSFYNGDTRQLNKEYITYVIKHLRYHTVYQDNDSHYNINKWGRIDV